MPFVYLLSALTFIFNTASIQSLPNFVFIIADDLGFNDIGYKQSTNSYTPDLDNLRLDSYELSRFYTYPKCAASRTSLFTGRYAHNIGMQHAFGSYLTCSIFEPSKQNTFFTEKLKSCLSYKNYHLGKWHLGHYKWTETATFRGMDYFKGFYGASLDYTTFKNANSDIPDWNENTNAVDPNPITDTYATKSIGEKAVNIIQNIANPNNPSYTAPFTLTVAFNAPHSPIDWAPQPYRTQVTSTNINTRAGIGSYPLKRKKYNSMVRAMDEQIDDIIKALQNNQINGQDIWDNTFLFFFSDNGAVITHGSNHPLRGAKDTNFEGGVRTEMLISGGLLSGSLKNQAYDGIIHITDIYATIMDIVSLTTADVYLDGESFAEILDDTITTPNTRDTIIINVDNTACAGNGPNGNLCGAIIKDYGSEGIFKLVIGNGIVGTSNKYMWNPLNNLLPNSITHCDPNSKGHGNSPPTLDVNTDCANNNNVCLFKLDDDPCEFVDQSQNTASEYTVKKQDLLNLLETAYNNQIQPIAGKSECHLSSASLIKSYLRSLNPPETDGYWQPYADNLPVPNSAFNLINSVAYNDICPGP
eukprot:161443_1